QCWNVLPFFVNKIGPFNNPSETYHYYELPFCSPDQIVKKKPSLGEVLRGDCLTNSLYESKFRVDNIQAALCQKKLSRNDVAKFRDTIIQDYYFQMDYDDLPFWGFIGKIEDVSWMAEGQQPQFFLFKHIQFNVLYSGGHIIEIHALSDPNDVVNITEDVEKDVKFTYSLYWNETASRFSNRVDRYTKTSKSPVKSQIYWFSIVNSIVIILLLMGYMVLVFLRHLGNELKRYSSGDEEEDKEVGWKYIHADVFRCPPYLHLLSAVLSSGVQIFTVIVLLFILAYIGKLYPYNHGALSASLVIIYVLTSAIAGYTAGSFYKQFAVTGWERSVMMVGMLFPGPPILTMFILNTIAICYGVTAALPLGTIVVIVLVYLVVSIPLLFLGAMIGYRSASVIEVSSATKKYPREIPDQTWYRRTPCQMFLAGLLPFSAIILELHHLYTSLWGYKSSTSPAVLLIMFLILIILIMMLSIGLSYIQLLAEDHEWWWRSVLYGGSTAIFMFCYSIYFYMKSSMSGFLQMAFFFGYSSCLCYAFFLMLGTISFHASFLFIRRIYHAIKSE
ncbi:hypothetical protein Leryth_000268, partial [Lithospermum erythrorhizon]